MLIQEDVHDVTLDVRLVLSNLTVSFFVINKSVDFVINFLLFKTGWLFNIVEKIYKDLLTHLIFKGEILLLDGLRPLEWRHILWDLQSFRFLSFEGE